MKQTKNAVKKGNPSIGRQRKFLLIVPILIFPFLTGAFWALGGGSGNQAVQPAEVHKGFNTTLPAPHFNKKETVLDKLGFYQKAAMDSARLAEKQKTDPYLAVRPIGSPAKGLAASTGSPFRGDEKTTYSAGRTEVTFTDPNEEKVAKRLEQLKKVISQPNLPAVPAALEGMPGLPSAPSLHSTPDIDRLEKLMQALKQTGDSTSHDPALDRLNSMLDKVLKIQHPELVAPARDKMSSSQPPAVVAVPVKATDGAITTLGSAQSQAADTGKEASPEIEDGFLAIDDNSGSPAETTNTFRAVIGEDQTLVSGATVKLRLTEDARVNGVTLPKDSYVFGTASLNNERLLINIKSIICDNSIYPVNWQVFDLDGMAGIFIPGAISRDVSKESAAEGVNGMGITSLDASLGAQAANAGIQAAKNLFSKKIKLVRVSVKAGYEVLLKESKTNS